ncbi:MAG: GNAT family protein [bacterium]
MADKKGKFATPEWLVGSKVYLRPATPEDVATFQYWSEQSNPEMLSCHAQPFLTPTQAAEKYKNREVSTSHQKFAVIRKDDQMLVGSVVFFNYNELNRSAELGLLIDPDERKNGHGKEALQLLASYLFKQRGLNKVYAQTAEPNEATVALLEGLGFKKDATLRDHYFFNSEFHNGVIYSLLLFELHW